MKRAANIFMAATLIFLLLLGLSSLVGEPLSDVLYAVACILPAMVALFAKCEGACVEKSRYLTFDTPRFLTFLPTVFPVVSITIALSALTAFVMSVTVGVSNLKTPEELGGSIVVALLLHALLPCVLEELLFRFVPLRLIAHRSPRWAVIISALFFSLVHTDFFVLPYALFAGAMFMMLDIALDSIYPSVILHLINNSLSVFLVFLGNDAVMSTMIYTILALLAIASLIFIFFKREKYIDFLKCAVAKGDGYKMSYEVLLVVVPCIILAVDRLVGMLAK